MTLWAWLTYPFRRQPRRLVDARPTPREQPETPLGMEATDLKLVQQVNRRNDALERVTGGQQRDATSRAATDITPFPEDETYAARYHSAFNKKGSNT